MKQGREERAMVGCCWLTEKSEKEGLGDRFRGFAVHSCPHGDPHCLKKCVPQRRARACSKVDTQTDLFFRLRLFIFFPFSSLGMVSADTRNGPAFDILVEAVLQYSL